MAAFAYVARNGTIQWYRNGEPVGNALAGQLGELNTMPLVLGNYEVEDDNWINRPYQGGIDDLGIWQRALSSNDILSIYANGLNGKLLSEEMDPISIESINAEGKNLTITFFTPFSTRTHSLESKSDLGQAWMAVEGGILSTWERAATVPRFLQLIHRASIKWFLLLHPCFRMTLNQELKDGLMVAVRMNGNWEPQPPVRGAASSGSNVYGTDLDGNFEANTDAWLQSPVIDLTDVPIANLTFVEFHQVDTEIDFHNVSVSVLDANSGDLISQVFVQAGATQGWTSRSVRLAGPNAGRPIRLEFRLVTDAIGQGAGFYIDDVVVSPN